MKIIAPNYYNNFRCIADKCRHSCCVGWEIDIDETTFEKYMNVSGDFGKKLKDNIDSSGETACFKLGKNERCPFLNKDNLCDVILTLGEENLCQICNDHPRFRNFYDGVTEIGLGLCCEAAAKLIISQEEKVTLDIIDDDGHDEEISKDEKKFFEFREKLFGILQSRSKTIEKRITELFSMCNTDSLQHDITKLTEIYLRLERLDSKWTDLLNELTSANISQDIALPSYFDRVGEQLLVYFLYRHLSDCLWDGRISQRVSLAVLSYRVIKYLCQLHIIKFGEISLDDIAEYVRMYSSEIEYSEENIEALLNYLS